MQAVRTKKTRLLTAQKLGYPIYNFKRIVRSMRKQIGVVESLMSAGRWDEIKYRKFRAVQWWFTARHYETWCWEIWRVYQQSRKWRGKDQWPQHYSLTILLRRPLRQREQQGTWSPVESLAGLCGERNKRFSYGGCVRFHERQTYGNINRSCNLFCREECGCIPQSVYDILWQTRDGYSEGRNPWTEDPQRKQSKLG